MIQHPNLFKDVIKVGKLMNTIITMYLSEVSDLGNPTPSYSDTKKLNIFLEISAFSKTLQGNQTNTDVCTFRDFFFSLIKVIKVTTQTLMRHTNDSDTSYIGTTNLRPKTD